jgi:hypothetical protein
MVLVMPPDGKATREFRRRQCDRIDPLQLPNRNCPSLAAQIIRATTGILRNSKVKLQLSESVPANTIANLTTAGNEWS